MIKKIILCILILIIYIMLINQVPTSIGGNGESDEQKRDRGFIVNIGMGASVNIGVKRPRFYGTIYESNGVKDVKMFNAFNLPLKRLGINFMWVHLLMLILLIFIIMKGGKKHEKRNETFSSSSSIYNLGNSFR